jgi:hypothetical protein
MKMELTMTPLRASRKLLAILASQDVVDFERFLRPNAYLQVWSDSYRQTFVSPKAISQALRRVAREWEKPTVNVESWDEIEDSATVSFQIWAKEQGLVAQQEHVLTVTLCEEQIEMIMLYCNPVSEFAS